MEIRWSLVAGWYQATLLVLAPWMAIWQPPWVPLLVAMAVVVRPLLRQTGPAEPWASLTVALSSLLLLVIYGGWTVTGGWFLLALLVVLMRWAFTNRRGGLLPDAASLVGLLGWGAAMALQPQLIETSHGGWLAPALLLIMARRLSLALLSRHSPVTTVLGSPNREVRGTLYLNQVVMAGDDGLPRSVPFELELRAGESLAVICDAPADVDALSQLLAGRRRPVSGEVTIDGVPISRDDRLVAVVAPGERFILGDLEENLAALCDEELDEGALVAVLEACSLSEIADILEDQSLSANGEPLSPLHRLTVLAARVIPSEYRVLVVVDPMQWVNMVRGEMWRAAVVRASVGRTSVWITADRELARRASRTMVFRQGSLRSE
jgi:predicted ABC-type transport system involved in lysophospholipase L1 biosynthesis ATPase subunit